MAIVCGILNVKSDTPRPCTLHPRPHPDQVHLKRFNFDSNRRRNNKFPFGSHWLRTKRRCSFQPDQSPYISHTHMLRIWGLGKKNDDHNGLATGRTAEHKVIKKGEPLRNNFWANKTQKKKRKKRKNQKAKTKGKTCGKTCSKCIWPLCPSWRVFKRKR